MCQILALFIICVVIQDVQSGCSRIPHGANGQRSAVDDNFKILIDGNPETYIPEHQYNVSLSCPSSLKFMSFTLVVESEDQSTIFNAQDMTGHFELVDASETKFSVGCENMIEGTNTNSKTRIDVSWIAPKNPESGCVLIKAAVVQHRDVWFIDDGFLTKRICVEEIDDLNSLTPALENCCACDEAKYEIVLERKWARNTHAKDFPPEAWRTRIGEIIGASHSYSYRYWAYGERASQGLQEMAEHGATRTLEQEIRDNTQNGEVRTMIKAPGIGYRKNVFGTTLANARVDPKHHQISLAAKVDPSPDWILGVAGLELCLSNCTWLDRKVLNLYPWDIGTDSGPSYESADQPQVPPDVIRRISSTYPSDYRSPFFDDTGAPMKPLATLYVTRKKLYVRECEEMPQEGPLECATHPWKEWSNCSTRCGQGDSQRSRSFKNPTLAASYNCDRRLEEIRQCQGTQCGKDEEPGNEGFENNYNNNNNNNNYNQNNNYNNNNNQNGPESMAKCELTAWTDWTPCTKSCGLGTMRRTRNYYNRQATFHCQSVVRLPLEETKDCITSECGGAIPDNGDFDGLSEVNAFGDINNQAGNSWSSGNSQIRLGTDKNNQGWQNNFSPTVTSENQHNYDENRELENSNNDPNYNYDEYEQGIRPSNNSPLNSGLNYNYNKNTQLNSGYNNNYNKNALLNTGSNYNNKSPDSNYNYNKNPQLNPGSSYNYNNKQQTSSSLNYNNNNNPYNSNSNSRFSSGSNTRYPDRQSDASSNYKVVQDYCYEKPYASTEPCLANPVVVRNYWFYDHDDEEGPKCKIFTTDNCDRNMNRFRTLKACEGTCIQPQINMVLGEDEDAVGNNQNGGEYGNGFGQPMSQTRSRYNNPRREQYGNY